MDAPTIPYLILHDPPGDNSSVTLTQNEMHCTNIDIAQGSGNQSSGNKAWKVGVKGSVNVFFVSIDFEAYYKETTAFAQSMSETQTTSTEVCISYFEAISTDDGIDVENPNPPGDDLFIGSSVKMLYGVFEGWSFEDCQLKFGKRLAVAPDKDLDPEEVRLYESDILLEIDRLEAIVSNAAASDYQRTPGTKSNRYLGTNFGH